MLHELIHLKHADHSKKFYDLLYTYMPDWKKRKERLEGC
ncbi:M48 family metallopeptidase [Campylobacter pinnipediorum]|nr:M48 family metallopeptidase [Campylobacter pinnipediorum]